jgi:hypothetical protein
MSDRELEAFKRQIDLREYAAKEGYVLDKRESWRGSAVMRKGGDKVIIKRDGDGHYVYFSVRDERDNGSIIDFIQHRSHLSLGSVRKELRPWIGKSAEAALPLFPAMPTTGKDRMRVETEYGRMQEAQRHRYLENERALPAAVLASERFAGRVRMDARGNAVFPHFDRQGLCGYEVKNTGFTGFAAGGEKGLWFSHARRDDTRLVFCESAIDALSHAALFPDAGARYASIGGKPNPVQPELIRAAIARMPAGSEIVAAMDSDADGAKLAGVVREAVASSGRSDLRFVAHEPSRSKDWNDELRAGVRQESKSRYLKVLVCGGRDFHDTKRVDEVLCKYAPSVVIHGCARGADTLASIWASQHGVREMKFPADWATHGKAAGMIRNAQMLQEGAPDMVIAFPGGKGTANMIALARRAGIRVDVVDQKSKSHEKATELRYECGIGC